MTCVPKAPRGGKQVVPVSESCPWVGARHADVGPLTVITCIHHWMIEPAFDHRSKGVCKYCGEEREFVNDWDEEYIKGLTAKPPGPRRV